MLKSVWKGLALVVALVGLLSATGFAATTVRSSVFPSTTPVGGTIVFHTGVANTSTTAEAVSVTLNITKPGTCVTSHLPANAGTLLMTLPGQNIRLSTLSLTVPPSSCTGTYTVTTTVKNSSGTVIATHTTTFTVTSVP